MIAASKVIEHIDGILHKECNIGLTPRDVDYTRGGRDAGFYELLGRDGKMKIRQLESTLGGHP